MRQVDPERAVRDFGRRVGEERGRLGWTQAEFAEKLDVSTRYIAHVEGGRQNLSIKSATRLANTLRVPLSTLLEPPQTRRPPRGRPRRANSSPA